MLSTGRRQLIIPYAGVDGPHRLRCALGLALPHLHLSVQNLPVKIARFDLKRQGGCGGCINEGVWGRGGGEGGWWCGGADNGRVGLLGRGDGRGPVTKTYDRGYACLIRGGEGAGGGGTGQEKVAQQSNPGQNTNSSSANTCRNLQHGTEQHGNVVEVL